MRRLGYVPGLDGIRGLAILAVVGRHYFRFPIGGGAGVDLFFVLSGFLIVSLFLEGRWATLRDFYKARARRLLPALLTMLAVYAVVELALGHLNVLRLVGLNGFYTANIFGAWFPHLVGRTPLGDLWSLAEEEQFYIVAPPLILLVLRLRDERRLKRVLIALAFAVITERTVLTYLGAPNLRLYCGPDTHADGLLLGAALAVSIRQNDRPRGGDLALPCLLLLMLIPAHWPWTVEVTMVNLAAMALIARVVTVPRSAVGQLMAWAPLRFLGMISYSLYLWQAAFTWWLHADANGPAHLYSRPFAALATVVAIAAAWLSYRFIETPFRQRSGLRGVPTAGQPMFWRWGRSREGAQEAEPASA